MNNLVISSGELGPLQLAMSVYSELGADIPKCRRICSKFSLSDICSNGILCFSKYLNEVDMKMFFEKVANKEDLRIVIVTVRTVDEMVELSPDFSEWFAERISK